MRTRSTTLKQMTEELRRNRQTRSSPSINRGQSTGEVMILDSEDKASDVIDYRRRKVPKKTILFSAQVPNPKMLLYLDRLEDQVYKFQRQWPAIKGVTDEHVAARESSELKQGGFGKGRILNRNNQNEAVHIRRELPFFDSEDDYYNSKQTGHPMDFEAPSFDLVNEQFDQQPHEVATNQAQSFNIFNEQCDQQPQKVADDQAPSLNRIDEHCDQQRYEAAPDQASSLKRIGEQCDLQQQEASAEQTPSFNSISEFCDQQQQESATDQECLNKIKRLADIVLKARDRYDVARRQFYGDARFAAELNNIHSNLVGKLNFESPTDSQSSASTSHNMNDNSTPNFGTPPNDKNNEMCMTLVPIEPIKCTPISVVRPMELWSEIKSSGKPPIHPDSSFKLHYERDRIGMKNKKKEFTQEVHEMNKRQRVPGQALRSPYYERVVQIYAKLTIEDSDMVVYVFDEQASKSDRLFVCKDIVGTLGDLQTLRPGDRVVDNVIDLWAAVLNQQETHRNPSSPLRFFCSVDSTKFSVYDHAESLEENAKQFMMNFQKTLVRFSASEFKKINLIFFPMIYQGHHFLVCFDLVSNVIEVIDNMKTDVPLNLKYGVTIQILLYNFCYMLKKMNHKKANIFDKLAPLRLQLPWGTIKDNFDSGVFLMRHMETYRGGGTKSWISGFCKEGPEQRRQIDKLRSRYLIQIVKSEVNEIRQEAFISCKDYNHPPKAVHGAAN